MIRIPEIFADLEVDILQALDAVCFKMLSKEYRLIGISEASALQTSAAAKFVSWNLPMHHSWPCCPPETPGFIEKAAQALWQKFRVSPPQTILVGALDSSDGQRYYRSLASNLRGRTLQLFPPQTASIRDAETQDSHASTLFCLVGKHGLFCGMQTPIASHGFHPGGTKYIRQNAPAAISRAGAKIAEALHHLKLYRPLPPATSHWLELGASPGGMTAELLARGYRVTAVDRAPLAQQLTHAPGLQAVLADAATFQPGRGTEYDAMLSDMNGDVDLAMSRVIRLATHLRVGGVLIFTLKMPGVSTFTAANDLEASVVNQAACAGLRLIARTHLTYNRHEFTLFFDRQPSIGRAGKYL
ncbi:MAG: hypothetical protein RLZZ282_1614 [Verrucomicrobiota bacterium]